MTECTLTCWKLILSLIVAHLLGDFLFQTRYHAENKHKASVLFFHTVLISVFSYILCGIWNAWQIPLIICVTHSIIDWIKSRFNEQSIALFLIDQAAHGMIIVALAFWLTTQPIPIFWDQALGTLYYQIMLIVGGLVLTVHAGSIVTGLVVKPFLTELLNARQLHQQDVSPESRGFENGGRMIGYLERALIFLFVMIGQPGGVGFLIAAKSIFRFGELKEHRLRMEAEYIIIGTLMSFGYGLAAAYLTKWVWDKIL